MSSWGWALSSVWWGLSARRRGERGIGRAGRAGQRGLQLCYAQQVSVACGEARLLMHIMRDACGRGESTSSAGGMAGAMAEPTTPRALRRPTDSFEWYAVEAAVRSLLPSSAASAGICILQVTFGEPTLICSTVQREVGMGSG